MVIPLLRTLNVSQRTAFIKSALFKRVISNASTDKQTKYSQKLRERAERQGVTVSQLLEKVKSDEGKRRQEEAKKLRAATEVLRQREPTPTQASTSSSKTSENPLTSSERKDATPFKALSSILNLPRILSTPHTSEQISALWTAYHASRSNGTGRGYVCASIPLDMFQKMANTGKQYPTFVLPLPRYQNDDPAAAANAATSGESKNQEKVAHEFYFMQWDFHAAPDVPLAAEDLFAKPSPSHAPSASASPNPGCATVLFTPLQEYKLRGAFATPYLVLTLYTDLAATHGIVLLRGEITPSTGGGMDRYMLSQEDAQMLTMSLQKFYLWNDSKGDGERLLRNFHEKPEEFKWQDLLDFSSLTV